MAYNLNSRIIILERIANFCINSTVVKVKQETCSCGRDEENGFEQGLEWGWYLRCNPFF